VRVLYLNPVGTLGGAERALLDLIAATREARPDWPLHLICGSDGPLIDRTRELEADASIVAFPGILARTGDAFAGGIDVFKAVRLGAVSVASTAYVSRLRADIRKIAPDVIHTNGFKMHIAAAVAGMAGVPLVWHIRDYLCSRSVMARVMPRLAKRCSVAVANSHSVAADVTRVCRRLDVRAVHDAIDLEEFAPEGPKLDLDKIASLPTASDGTVRVGLIATMARWKGQEVFLKAIARAAAELPIRGYIIGGAIYQTDDSQYSLDDLQGIARDLGISGMVGFTGFVDRPASAIRALDIAVHASTSPEPFGLVIAEAMACGKASVVTPVGGSAELVSDGVDCLTAPSGNAGALAEAIVRLAKDPSLRSRLGENGRAAALRKFDRRRLADEVIEIYERTVAEAA
jgi:glycosyltransferase involved in cell wall biosynthesis